jgi:DNA primase
LTAKEIETALSKKVVLGRQKTKKRRKKILVPKEIVKASNNLKGTLKAILLDEKMKEVANLTVSELADKIQEIKGINTVVFDGVTTQRLIDIACEKKIKYLISARISDIVKQPLNIRLLTFKDILD